MRVAILADNPGAGLGFAFWLYLGLDNLEDDISWLYRGRFGLRVGGVAAVAPGDIVDGSHGVCCTFCNCLSSILKLKIGCNSMTSNLLCGLTIHLHLFF